MKRRLSFLLILTSLVLYSSMLMAQALRIDFRGGRLLLTLKKDAPLGDYVLAGRQVDLSTDRLWSMRIFPGQRMYPPMLVRLSIEADSLRILRERRGGASLEPWLALPYIRRRPLVVDATALLVDRHEGIDAMATAKLGIRPLETIVERAYHHADGVEVDIREAFIHKGDTITSKARRSLWLLPEKPMLPRLDDARIGYKQTIRRTANGSRRYIDRYRLIPSDTTAYLCGNPVRPLRPITFYMDDRIPALWQNAIRAGVSDWRTAFEKIGYLDAIEVKLYSEADKGFDPNGRVNTIRYVDRPIGNAKGDHWVDPRTGEILQSEVLVMARLDSFLHQQLFLQTASYNPLARSKTLPDSILHRMIRYATAHELGHCLGLEHNFRASASYATDSLRSRTFTDRYGTTPSIMDYTRFNYVAQPADSVRAYYPPLIGEYDQFALAYGYCWFSEGGDEDLLRWSDSLTTHLHHRYEKRIISAEAQDPLVRQYDLGDDPLRSAEYGVCNIRYILANASRWGGWCQLPVSYAEVLDAYARLLSDLGSVLSGTIYHTKSRDGREVMKTKYPEEYRARTRQFILSELPILRQHIILHPKSAERLMRRLADVEVLVMQ